VALFEAVEAQYHQREHVLQMPGRLHLHKEFTAKKNIRADILKEPITDSEGATSNNLTVQANNLSSEKGDKERSKQRGWVCSPLMSIPSLKTTSTST
jgi:hypothetical protein